MYKKIVVSLAVLLMLFAVSSADVVINERSVRHAVLACSEIANQDERVRCYDELAETMRKSGFDKSSTFDDASLPMKEFVVEAEERTLTVTKASTNARNEWLFYMDNGEVWKQSDTRRRRLPDLPVSATLSKGSFGYRIKVEGKSWSMKVKRLK